jgi:hypothetical protein
MFLRSWALAVLLLLLGCGTAAAAPVTVQLRVEGAASTLFEGPVTTDGHAVDGGDGTGAHPCDGTNFGAYPTPGPTMTAALDDAHVTDGWQGSWGSGFEDFLIDRVGPDAGSSLTTYWGTVLNFQPTPRGGCQMQVAAGDQLLFAFGDVYGQPLLRLEGPARVKTGDPAKMSVTDGKTDAAVAGADVGGSQTAADGSASVTFASTGLVALKASKAGSVRSNVVNVCVSDTGTGDCGVRPAQLGAPATVKDTRAPLARISGPVDGRTYARGPRILRGVASDAETGVTQVKLAFRRHANGRCRWWSGRRERFVGSNCHKKFFFAIGQDASWSYLLPRALPPGRYVLDVKAFDRARNRDERFQRGRNRVVFYVASHRGTAARSSARRGASVDVMVVGRDRTLATAGSFRARPSLVRAGKRSCKVAASTPLSALVAALRRARVGYRLRDYGDCSRTTAAGSGQLYVSRIGSDPGRGDDGWFYKVNDRAPEIGSADPSAATLKRGDRVLWFYCVFDGKAKSCQRSLRLAPVAGATGKNPLPVRVRGYDNAGRFVPVAGATVTFGRSTVLSGADGIATVPVAPGVSAGHPTLFAAKAGMIPSFPIGLEVAEGK